MSDIKERLRGGARMVREDVFQADADLMDEAADHLASLQSKLAEAERALEQICMFGEPQEIMEEPEEFGGTDDGAETLCMAYENVQIIAGRALVNIRSDASIREEEPLPAKQGE